MRMKNVLRLLAITLVASCASKGITTNQSSLEGLIISHCPTNFETYMKEPPTPPYYGPQQSCPSYGEMESCPATVSSIPLPEPAQKIAFWGFNKTDDILEWDIIPGDIVSSVQADMQSIENHWPCYAAGTDQQIGALDSYMTYLAALYFKLTFEDRDAEALQIADYYLLLGNIHAAGDLRAPFSQNPSLTKATLIDITLDALYGPIYSEHGYNKEHQPNKLSARYIFSGQLKELFASHYTCKTSALTREEKQKRPKFFAGLCDLRRFENLDYHDQQSEKDNTHSYTYEIIFNLAVRNFITSEE